MKNIIIFGGAGFIGTNLTIELLKNSDNKIICVDNLYTGRYSNMFNFIDNTAQYRFVHCDVTDVIMLPVKMAIGEFFGSRVDEIYNLACPASPKKYQEDPIHTIDTCYAVKHIGALAYQYSAKLLHASTSEIYGNPDDIHHPQSEEYNGNVNPIGPRSCYDEGKRIAETILEIYHRKGLDVKVVRIFNTYGPYMDPLDGRVITNFISQALHDEPITIYGSGTQTRSFQYVTDLIAGMMDVMKTEKSYFGPVNIGSPYEVTVSELAELILKLIPESKSEIVYKKLPKDDPERRRANTARLHYLSGWTPKVTLEEGLTKFIEFFRENEY